MNKQAGKPQRQCRKCPWRTDVDPNDIPNGYCSTKHRGLADTIAAPGVPSQGALKLMACHESPIGRERVCVGWLHNQLGVGNNIGMRLAVHSKRVSANYELVGPQHERFEDTLPEAP